MALFTGPIKGLLAHKLMGYFCVAVLVALVCVSASRPIIVAWRLLSGQASEKGQEAVVTRSLIEQGLQVAGPQAISLLLADALYADGPLLAWLKYRQGIDAQVELARGSFALPGSARAGRWAANFLDSPSLCTHDPGPQAAEAAAEPPRALVSTRRFSDGFAALQAFRPRWHIEDDAYRELKEGWGLEQQRWGRDVAAALGRTTLTCLAFNTAQVYRLQAGERLASMAIRRLRRQRQRQLGSAPAVLYVAGCYGVFSK